MSFPTGTIAIGSDHRARTIVDAIADHLISSGWTVHKYYGGDADSVDYPAKDRQSQLLGIHDLNVVNPLKLLY